MGVNGREINLTHGLAVLGQAWRIRTERRPGGHRLWLIYKVLDSVCQAKLVVVKHTKHKTTRITQTAQPSEHMNHIAFYHPTYWAYGHTQPHHLYDQPSRQTDTRNHNTFNAQPIGQHHPAQPNG